MPDVYDIVIKVEDMSLTTVLRMTLYDVTRAQIDNQITNLQFMFPLCEVNEYQIGE